MARPHPLLSSLVAGGAIDPERVTAAVVDSAIEHRVSGLLLAGIGGDIGAVPRRAAVDLVAFDMAVAARRGQQLAALRVVEQSLVTLDHVVFKGITSASQWFDDPLHRPFSDLDIVLAPGLTLAEAVEALQPGHPRRGAIESLPRGHSLSVRMEVEGVTVDLQTDALRMGIGPRHPHEWWRATRPLHISGIGTIKAFDRDADLVLFLLHQARDRFRYLLGLAEASRRFAAGPDWDRVEDLARGEGIWDQVAVAIELICEELDLPCPVTVPDTWRARLWRRLWARDVRWLGELGRVRHVRRANWMMPLTTRTRAGHAIRWMARTAVPPASMLLLAHPDATGPYLWRLLSSRTRIIARRRAWAWRQGRRKERG